MESFIFNSFDNQLQLSVNRVINSFKNNFKEEIYIEIEKEILNGFYQMNGRYKENIIDYKKDNFIQPILTMVEFLPIKELANIAESLLNIISLKKKLSMEIETVGGPMDVAVITKVDGFKWIKNK